MLVNVTSSVVLGKELLIGLCPPSAVSAGVGA